MIAPQMRVFNIKQLQILNDLSAKRLQYAYYLVCVAHYQLSQSKVVVCYLLFGLDYQILLSQAYNLICYAHNDVRPIMINYVMLKILFFTPSIKCSMVTLGCVISVVICVILTFVCVMLIVRNQLYALGYLCNLFSHHHNSVSYLCD